MHEDAITPPLAAPAVLEVSHAKPARSEWLASLSLILASAAITMLALVPIGVVLYQRMPPALATIDLQKLVLEDQERFVASLGGTVDNLTDEKRTANERNTVLFATKLSTVVEQIGAECRCVLVNKAALLNGGTSDYTDLVRDRMRK